MDSILSICRGLRELALFAGAGGGILGGHLLGWRTVCAVEIEPYCQSVLCQRQNEGILPPFPIWDDIRTFDGKPWKGAVDVISGGFPCQDISAANQKGDGIKGKRSGLWKEMWRIVCEVRPQFVYVENSPLLTSKGLDTVLGDLAESGYDAVWGVLGGGDIGAPHERKRIWILARAIPDPSQTRCEQSRCNSGNNNLQGQSGIGNFCDVFPDSACTQRKSGNINPRHEETRIRTGSPGENNAWNKRLTWRETDTNRDRSNGERWKEWVKSFEKIISLEAVEVFKKLRLHNTARDERNSLSDWWKAEPGICRVVDGLANRVDRIAALGNGQIPAVAALMFCLLLERMLKNNA